MTTSAQRIRKYRGPAILSFGFRPLFLSAGLWAVIAMLLWVSMLSGLIILPSGFSAVNWHVHELLYGYMPAVMAGFLLTAVPNWTKRLPITGRPLLVLTLIWWVGRLAIFLSASLGVWLTALLDLAFLVFLVFLIAREIIAGKNWRNLKVLVPIILLLTGNVIFHLEAANVLSTVRLGERFGLAAAILLISLIGGRIIPSFTRNWLNKNAVPKLPAPFGTPDKIALASGAAALIAWIFWPEATVTAYLCLLAGLAHFWRLSRWAGLQTLKEPLVWILHIGYAFIPTGFLLVAVSTLWAGSILPTAALHAWTAGAIGTMTLAVMTRASLGHAGRPLKATPMITLLYGCIIASAGLRILTGIGAGFPDLVYLAGALWLASYSIFVMVFGPILWRPRS